MTHAKPDDGVLRTDVVLRADPTRVLARLFVPGQELSVDGRSRASGVLDRVLALPEDEVAATLKRVLARYAERHRDLAGALRANYERVAHRVPQDVDPSPERRDLIGACFTNEYSVEAAALFNPSVVAHPDQSGLAPGEIRFVMSLRAVGEGHLSSVEFRTGVVGPGQAVRVDDPGPHIESGRVGPTSHDRGVFAALLAEQDVDRESAAFVVGLLPARFDDAQVETALAALRRQRLTRSGTRRTDEHARRIVADSYAVEFRPDSAISERVLWPHAPAESHGIEDARFVRDEDAGTYRATYTAFDGRSIAPRLIETDDFRVFHMSQLAGPAAQNKGMALFPRKVGGRHVALSRWDGENNAVTTSRDGLWWGDPRATGHPRQPVGAHPDRQLRLTGGDRQRAGSCSPTASARCASTPSAPCCSTSTTRPRSSAPCGNPCWCPRTTNATATCPTSCTRAGRCGSVSSCCWPTG